MFAGACVGREVVGKVTMGICYWDAKMLWDARVQGAQFGTTLTIGRLALNLHPHEVAEFRRKHAESFPGSVDPLRDYKFRSYVDPFLRETLGATAVEVMDYSDYEGADVIHDLNQPVPSALHERFDAVIDGGTLEHVFNFPVAIANLMNMTKTGGRLFLFLPANNLCGHGFYQFSPELMFRVFTAQNGFETERIVLWEAGYPGVELTPGGVAHEVVDPLKVRKRVGLLSRGPVIMIVQAKKLATVPLFAAPPLQSDYSAIWEQANTRTPVRQTFPRALAGKVWRALPHFMKVRIRGRLQRHEFSFVNRMFYRPLKPGRTL